MEAVTGIDGLGSYPAGIINPDRSGRGNELQPNAIGDCQTGRLDIRPFPETIADIGKS
jgi:hypothetical protein